MYDLPLKDGKRRQKTETLENVSEKRAKALLAKREEAVANGEYVQDSITIAELFSKFLDQKRDRVKLGEFSPNTLDRYEQLFENYLRPAFGDFSVKELKRIHLSETYQQWCNEGPHGRKVSARTVLHAHDLLRAALHWGRRRELVTRNVAALLTRDELPKAITPEPKPLDEDELRLLLDAAQHPTKSALTQGAPSSQPWFYPAVAFAAYTGCRRGEILALRWSEIDFRTKTITISRSLTSRLQVKSPKNGRSRKITAPQSLLKILMGHQSAQAKHRELLGGNYKKTDLVFAHADGSPITPRHFGSAVKRLIERIGTESATLHNLRDTHASLLAKAGVPIEVVSKRLGHANIGITMERYLSVYRDQDVDAAEKFEQLVG
jgi:integrase